MFYSDCRVVRDPQTLKSKGYGFVSFVKKAVSWELSLCCILLFLGLNFGLRVPVLIVTSKFVYFLVYLMTLISLLSRLLIFDVLLFEENLSIFCIFPDDINLFDECRIYDQ